MLRLKIDTKKVFIKNESMIIFTPIFENTQKEKPPVPKYDGFNMSLEEFLNFEFNDPGFKYEWNNGIVETEVLMKDSERYIIDNIIRRFYQTKAFEKGDNILPEADVYLEGLNKYRRPDATFFQKDQIRLPSAYKTVPSFIIELISPSNTSYTYRKTKK